ncbi:hypothetical protein AAAC51_01180 [Priestia megaterium]
MNIVETLIKLIINNAFIFVIVGGIIFNVVQRFMAQSKEEEKQRSKRAPMPPVNNPSRRKDLDIDLSKKSQKQLVWSRKLFLQQKQILCKKNWKS